MSAPLTPRRRGAAPLGVLSVLPLVLTGLAIVGFALDWIQTARYVVDFEGPAAGPVSRGVLDPAVWLVAAIAAMVLSACLLVFYCIDAARNRAMPADRRALWIVALLIGTAFVFPAYWFVFWWRNAERQPAAA